MDAKVLNSALEWVERQTHLCTKQARMLSNGDQGCLLQAFSLMVKPLHILELGAFTGYSTICLSRGLQEGGSIDTIEVYDELEDIIRGGFRRAGLIDVAGREDTAHLHIGDAKKIIPTLDKMYDIVYIDANKREYCEYYDLVFDMVRPGGLILADNVLWDGKVCQNPLPQDKQTLGIAAFNDKVSADPRVESVIMPLRDGLNIIRLRK